MIYVSFYGYLYYFRVGITYQLYIVCIIIARKYNDHDTKCIKRRKYRSGSGLTKGADIFIYVISSLAAVLHLAPKMLVFVYY